MLRDLSADNDFFVAAGDEGRVVTDRGGGWHEIDLGTSMDFVSVNAWEGIIAASGPEGFAFGDGESAIDCATAAPFTALFARSHHGGSGTALTLLSEQKVLELWRDGTDLRSCSRPADFAGSPRDVGLAYGSVMDGIGGYALTTGGTYWRLEWSSAE